MSISRAKGLTKLSALRAIQCRMMGWLMNNEFELKRRCGLIECNIQARVWKDRRGGLQAEPRTQNLQNSKRWPLVLHISDSKHYTTLLHWARYCTSTYTFSLRYYKNCSCLSKLLLITRDCMLPLRNITEERRSHLFRDRLPRNVCKELQLYVA